MDTGRLAGMEPQERLDGRQFRIQAPRSLLVHREQGRRMRHGRQRQGMGQRLARAFPRHHGHRLLGCARRRRRWRTRRKRRQLPQRKSHRHALFQGRRLPGHIVQQGRLHRLPSRLRSHPQSLVDRPQGKLERKPRRHHGRVYDHPRHHGNVPHKTLLPQRRHREPYRHRLLQHPGANHRNPRLPGSLPSRRLPRRQLGRLLHKI